MLSLCQLIRPSLLLQCIASSLMASCNPFFLVQKTNIVPRRIASQRICASTQTMTSSGRHLLLPLPLPLLLVADEIRPNTHTHPLQSPLPPPPPDSFIPFFLFYPFIPHVSLSLPIVSQRVNVPNCPSVQLCYCCCDQLLQ